MGATQKYARVCEYMYVCVATPTRPVYKHTHCHTHIYLHALEHVLSRENTPQAQTKRALQWLFNATPRGSKNVSFLFYTARVHRYIYSNSKFNRKLSKKHCKN